MLHHGKMAQAIQHVSDALFSHHYQPTWLTLDAWRQLTQDEQFNERIRTKRDSCSLATWQGDLAAIFPVQPQEGAYAALAVDGSQIYPDRHLQGVECFLINTGGCLLSYAQPVSSAQLFSDPLVYTPALVANYLPNLPFAADTVDLIREEQEFIAMAKQAAAYQATAGQLPFLCLVDGNLYFWPLESKSAEVRTLFLTRYLRQLKRLYEQRIMTAGYLSSTRFRDLVALVDVGLCKGGVAPTLPPACTDLCAVVDTMTDAELLAFVLPPFYRTTVFACNAPLIASYPEPLRPHFFYLHVGSEIVRIEIPAWIAQDPTLVAQVSAICLDQANKGYGYPVALAEAHAQAVVQGADRELFYQLIVALGVRNNKRVGFSPKSMKKKILGF